MKRLLTLLTACIAACAATAQSRIETFTFRSALLGAEKTCSVYLPAGYDDSGRSYPVLYLLHGASGYHGDWAEKGNMRQIADEAIAAGTALPMIVVMPDASGTGENYTGDRMGYFDVPGWPYERFFFEEFVPAVERRYRICGDKARRAISGLSMGGGGTAVYALRHPELFGSACPMSGLLEAYGDPGENAFRRSVAENNPVQMVRDLSDAEAAAQHTVRWWVDCGDDDFLALANIHFYEAMRLRDIPLQYRMRDGGHTWRYWQTALHDILAFVSVGFAE